MVRLRLKISKECLTTNHYYKLVSVVTGWRLNESLTNLTHGGESEFGWDGTLHQTHNLIGTPGGVIQVRTVRRLTREQRTG